MIQDDLLQLVDLVPLHEIQNNKHLGSRLALEAFLHRHDIVDGVLHYLESSRSHPLHKYFLVLSSQHEKYPVEHRTHHSQHHLVSVYLVGDSILDDLEGDVWRDV